MTFVAIGPTHEKSLMKKPDIIVTLFGRFCPGDSVLGRFCLEIVYFTSSEGEHQGSPAVGQLLLGVNFQYIYHIASMTIYRKNPGI